MKLLLVASPPGCWCCCNSSSSSTSSTGTSPAAASSCSSCLHRDSSCAIAAPVSIWFSPVGKERKKRRVLQCPWRERKELFSCLETVDDHGNATGGGGGFSAGGGCWWWWWWWWCWRERGGEDVPPMHVIGEELQEEEEEEYRMRRRVESGEGRGRMARTVKEGWMVRYGRRKIGRSFFHKRYFVLESLVLAYYKRKPSDQEVPLKSLAIDGNCRVDDRGLETHHGHAVYMLSVYSKKDRSHRITVLCYVQMGALNIQEACAWKEALERVIDQYQNQHASSGQMLISHERKESVELERTASSSDRESPGLSGKSQVEEDEKEQMGVSREPNGSSGSLDDWGERVEPPRWGPLDAEAAAASRRHWHLVRCQNGLRFFEEVPDFDNNTQSRITAMKVVGVIEATCEQIFEHIMGMDETRYEWDCSFHHGRIVQGVDGHTAILHHCLQLDWFRMFLWPRDLCYVRYWRRNDDGSYVILFRSQEHPSCPPQPGCVRAHLENGGFTITPLKQRGGSQVRARVQHLVQIDLRGWGANYIPACHHSSVTQMLNSVAGLREWFAQRDGDQAPSPVQRIVKMGSETLPGKKLRKRHSGLQPSASLDNMLTGRHLGLQESDDEDVVFHSLSDCKTVYRVKSTSLPGAGSRSNALSTAVNGEAIDLPLFSGSLSKGAHDTGKNCWSIPEKDSFRVRSKRFLVDKSKTPAGEPLMQLVAVDWFKDSKRIDHVVRCKDCVAQVAAERGLFTLAFNVQVPAANHYSMVFYFVASNAPQQGSLLQRFVDGDDNFRNSRLKLIPLVPKGSWIVRQSVGSTPCILGKAVDCSYYRGPNYLEVDVDIGSSTVANGVLGLVFGVITSLVVDMAFLVQGNRMDELPERLIGSVRVSHLQLSSAVSPSLDNS